MPDYYKLVGHKQSTTVWTTGVVLEVGDDGEPTKVVNAGEPVQLTAADRKKLEGMGFVVEESSAKEAEEVAEARQIVGDDISGGSPVFTTGAVDQDTNDK